MYTSVHLADPGKVIALPMEQATFIKPRIALMWMRCLNLFHNYKFLRELMITV